MATPGHDGFPMSSVGGAGSSGEEQSDAAARRARQAAGVQVQGTRTSGSHRKSESSARRKSGADPRKKSDSGLLQRTASWSKNSSFATSVGRPSRRSTEQKLGSREAEKQRVKTIDEAFAKARILRLRVSGFLTIAGTICILLPAPDIFSGVLYSVDDTSRLILGCRNSMVMTLVRVTVGGVREEEWWVVAHRAQHGLELGSATLDLERAVDPLPVLTHTHMLQSTRTHSHTHTACSGDPGSDDATHTAQDTRTGHTDTRTGNNEKSFVRECYTSLTTYSPGNESAKVNKLAATAS